MREEMVRCHKIDIVDLMLPDHIFYLFEQSLCTNFYAQAFVGNLIILAERTPKRAARKKDCSRAIHARDRRFLPEMGSHIGHPELIRFTAKP